MNPYETTPTNFIRAIGSTLSGPSYPLLYAKYGHIYGSTFLGWQSVTVDHTVDTIRISTAYSVSVNDAVTFNGTSMPSPLVYGTTYYIRTVSSGGGYYTCTLSTSVSGPLLSLTSNGTGVTMYSNMFKVPDYRGYFIRGYANGASADPERSSRDARGDGYAGDYIGTSQDHAFEDHRHLPYNGSYPFVYLQSSAGMSGWVQITNMYSAYYTGLSYGGTASAYETRSINKSVDFIIKYQ
jgi:hypothetical protein